MNPKPANKDELTTLPPSAVVIPEWVKEMQAAAPAESGKARGMIEDDSNLLAPPRYKILHPMCGEVADGKGSAGSLWSLFQDREVDLPFEFIPVAFEKEWMAFDSNTGTLAWRTTDPDDPDVRALGGEAWKAEVTHMGVLPISEAGIPVEQTPHIFTFMGMQFKAGKRLYGDVALRLQRAGLANNKDAGPFLFRYAMTNIRQCKGDKGVYFMPDFKFVGWVEQSQLPELRNLSASPLTPPEVDSDHTTGARTGVVSGEDPFGD